MPLVRWTTSPRATRHLYRAGATAEAARALVAEACAQHGRSRRGPRPGYLPVWLVADLADVVRRLAAGETLEDIDDDW